MREVEADSEGRWGAAGLLLAKKKMIAHKGSRPSGGDRCRRRVTLGIRVPETDRFGSSGIRVPRNWNRSVPSSVSGNSVSGSGNSVWFRVFPNGTEKK